MSGLSKNLTIALFLLFVLSLRAVIAEECRPQDALQYSGRVFCTVQMELWLGGTTFSSGNVSESIHLTKGPDNYPEELTRPLGKAIWALTHNGP